MQLEKNKRILALDFIKGLCIIMVILTHVPFTAAIKKAMLYPFTILPAVPMFLMCSVYAFSLSEDRKPDGGSIWGWFEPTAFKKRFNRLFLPYCIAIFITVVVLMIVKNMKRIAFLSVLKILLQGGRGPGSYYVVILFSLLVIFPFLYQAFHRHPTITVLGLVCAQIVYEFFCQFWQMPQLTYNILIFRYFTHLALGFLLYTYLPQLQKSVLPGIAMAIGAVYIVAQYYFNYEPVFIYLHQNRSVIACLFSFGALCYLFKLEGILQKHRKFFAPLLYCGRASFHIMLTQMVYFYFARMVGFEEHFSNLLIVAIVDLAICLPVGCLFFWCEQQARQLWKRIKPDSKSVQKVI